MHIVKENVQKDDTMDESQRDVLLQEYQSLAGYIQHFYILRASVLGLGAAMVGALLSTSLSAHFPMSHMLDALAALLIFTIERMLGATVRPPYVFACRMTDISEKFGVIPYWRFWRCYLKKRPHDGGQYTYLIAMRFLIVASALWIIAHHGDALRKLLLGNITLPNVFSAILIGITAPFLGWRLHRVDDELDPKRFVDKIEKAWNESCTEIRSTVDNTNTNVGPDKGVQET
jgi:hypothetical protein